MDYLYQEWRLLITPASRGAWNMAVDEAILEAVEQSRMPPTLRLYAWVPPCLSIGYAQSFEDINIPSLNALGWDWVRRPTGGRAILHTDELTYSVIAPQSNPRVSGGVLESYQRLSFALLAALHYLNLPAESQPGGKVRGNQENGSVCFDVPSDYEIIVDGRKLIGSAQVRRKNAMLQHGTLPLTGDLTRIIKVLTFSNEANRLAASTSLLSHASTVEMILGDQISWEKAAIAFVSGFQTELNITLIRSELSDQEIACAQVLEQEKYSHPTWLERL